MSESEIHNDSEEHIPDEVLAELKNRYGPVPAVPDVVDQAILTDARRSLNGISSAPRRQRGSTRIRWTLLSVGSILTVMLLIAVIPVQPQRDVQLADSMLDESKQRGIAPMAAVADPEPIAVARSKKSNAGLFDINGDGRIDILDAFALARTIESGETNKPGDQGWDINQDGELNQLDVDLVALHVVKL